MQNLITTEGHKLIVCPDPQGVKFGLITSRPQFEDDVTDVFTIRLRFSSILLALSDMELPLGYSPDDGQSKLSLHDNCLRFSLRYKHKPTELFETNLSQKDTERVRGFLRETVNGGAQPSIKATQKAGNRKVGRNDPCSCGSGKKAKHCCGTNKTSAIPQPDLSPFRNTSDPNVDGYLSGASGRADVLFDYSFWQGLARLLGTAGHNELALVAFDRALALKPNDELLLADKAVTIGNMGQRDECLSRLLSLPNTNGVLHVLIANTLSDLAHFENAIPYYEKAIEVEPDFELPYHRLLICLWETKSSLMEYWTLRAARRFRDSPTIAHAYCHFLLENNRLEELAEAEWIDRLAFTPDDFRMIGRGTDHPRLIVEAQILRLLGMFINEESLPHLEKAANIVESSPKTWHLCKSAERIGFLAAQYGRRDLVWKASRKFCESCRRTRLGPAVLQGMLARAALVSDNPSEALKDIELGLLASPEHLDLLSLKWWALDEVGQSEDAIPVARRVHAQLPEFPNLSYNIGYLCGKMGRLAMAIDYYCEDIRKHPKNIFAIENLALIRLMEGKVELARQLAANWTALSVNLMDGDLLQAKCSKYDLLEKFAEANKASPTYAFDLERLNASSNPFWGARTGIPERKLSQAELIRALDLDENEKKEVRYSHEMVLRGDFSATVKVLSSELPNIHEMPREALLSLVAGQRQLDDESRADYAPAILAFGKAREILLREYIFLPYRERVRAALDFASVAAESADKAFDQASGFSKFVIREAHLELGGMARTLQLCGGRTGHNMALMVRFKAFILEVLQNPAVLDIAFTEGVAMLASKYRNPAVHANSFDRNTAFRVRQEILNRMKCLRRSKC